MPPCTACPFENFGALLFRYLLTPSAAPLPSAIAHTTRDWPRRQSPAAKTPAIDVANCPYSACGQPKPFFNKKQQCAGSMPEDKTYVTELLNVPLGSAGLSYMMPQICTMSTAHERLPSFTHTSRHDLYSFKLVRALLQCNKCV